MVQEPIWALLMHPSGTNSIGVFLVWGTFDAFENIRFDTVFSEPMPGIDRRPWEVKPLLRASSDDVELMQICCFICQAFSSA